MIKSFLDLEVYKESFQLSLEIEILVKTFPSHEKYLLVDQMRRASRAVPALIAEGYAKRQSVKEFKKFLRDSMAEANEMINHLAFSKSQSYIRVNKGDELINRYHVVGRKLNNLEKKWVKF